MAFNLRKVLASMLVVLLMINMLPQGLSQGLRPGTVAQAEALEEALEEAPSDGQSEPPASDASGETGGDQTPAPDADATEAPADPTEQPDQPQQGDATAAPGETDMASPEPSEQPAEQPVEQPTEQPVEQPVEQPAEQPLGGPEGDVQAKATVVVTGVTIIASEDAEEKPLAAAAIQLNADVSHELNLTAKLSYNAPGASANVRWTTSNGKVAKIAPNGLDCTVTGLKAGTVTITAAATDGSGIKATCKVTVARLVEDITVSSASQSVVAGFTQTYTAQVLPSNATNKAVEWFSGDLTVATVSAKGVVKGVAPGNTTITARAKDGSLVEGTLDVTVLPVVSEIQLTADGEETSAASIDINSDKKSILLKAETIPADATQVVGWSTSSAKIASITQNGMECTVTGVAVGTATITCTAKDGSGKKSAFTVTVTRLAKDITITGPTTTMMGGGRMTLTATVTPSKTTNKAVNWTPSDDSIATVSSKGVVTAMAVTEPATVTITATAKDGSGVFGTYDIQVTPAAAEVKVEAEGGASNVIDLSEADPLDRTLQLKAVISPGNASQEVTWTTSNGKVARVDATGLVTGVAVGTATITARHSQGRFR